MIDNNVPTERSGETPCPKGKIERFIEPCLLLLLAEKSAHGYELMDNLEQFGFDPRCQDPGQIYRYLRRMETEGLVESAWESGDSGPARRSYQITGDGLSLLASWMKTLEKRITIINKLITRYQQTIQKGDV
ncbi:MAG: helix-turn-helix transcriptional regulator [Clostridiales bacterium]|jgi:poly-beta-hydroxybutyrate-responsive repressor|nr:helix-turn-helix transcriptional regulator [Clostridiales bacterium]